MPTYEYACNKCGHHFEVVQSFHEAPRKRCPQCRGALRKVFGTPGIVLKGGGFYKTDSRGTSSASTPGGSSSSSPSPSGESNSGATSSGDAS